MAAAESSVSSSVVSAEALTYAVSKLGKSELIMKEEQKLAIFSLFSVRGVFCMAANGSQDEYLFPNASVYVQQAAHRLGPISKKKND